MKKIPKERKEAILAKRSGPDRQPVAVVAAKEGLRTGTWTNTPKQALRSARRLPESGDGLEGGSGRVGLNFLKLEG